MKTEFKEKFKQRSVATKISFRGHSMLRYFQLSTYIWKCDN